MGRKPQIVQFSAKSWSLGAWYQSPGRPRAFDDAAEQRMQEKFREQALREAKHYGRLPGAEAKTTVALVREFADAEGVKAADRTLRTRVINPVLRELKNKV
jgi:hypothetical protein